MKTLTTLNIPFQPYVVDTKTNEIFTMSNIMAKGKLFKLTPIKEMIYRLTVDGIRKTVNFNTLVSEFLGGNFVDESNLVQLVKPYQDYKIDKTTNSLYHAATMKRVPNIDGIYKVVGRFGDTKVTAHEDFEYMSFFTTNLICE